MTAITQALSAALLHFVWQGLLVAILLSVARFVLRKRSANARYAAGVMALGVVALLPVATTWALYRQSDTTPAAATLTNYATPLAGALPRATETTMPWAAVVLAWALPVWSAGVLVFALRLAWGCRQVAVLRRAGESAPEVVAGIASALRHRMGLERAVKLVVTERGESPSVVGWLRPVVLLPAATLAGLTAEQLEAILAHELAHIRRHDYLVNLLQSLVETLLFYHPAVWWISALVRHERELCCDDIAVQSCGDKVCYARALTRLERLRGGSAALALGSTGGSLLYRIQRLMGIPAHETLPSRSAALAAAILAIACLAFQINAARAQQSETPYEPTSRVARDSDDAGVHIDLGGAQIARRSGVEYPGAAWEHQIGGLVVVEATLDAVGYVSDARVLSGPVELRRAALQSILDWQFAPAGGSTRQISFNFQWEEAQKSRAGARTRTVIMSDGKAYAFTSPTYALVPDGPSFLLTRIDVAGISEAQQKQIVERLGLRIGNLTNPEQLAAMRETAAAFDPPMILELTRSPDNRITIRIVPR